MDATGTVLTTNCYAYHDNNVGCGVKDERWQSYGAGFNQQGGSYAMLWDDDGIKVWFWPNSKIPWDLRRARPIPSQWGSPAAAWDASACDPDDFIDPQLIIM